MKIYKKQLYVGAFWLFVFSLLAAFIAKDTTLFGVDMALGYFALIIAWSFKNEE